MRVLVTGARGLYGVHLIDWLVRQPFVETVYALDNQSRQTLEPDPFIRSPEFEKKVRMLTMPYERLDAPKLNQMACDCVVHLAAYVSIDESMVDPAEYFENNERGTFYFLQALRKTIRQPLLVYASSPEVYGAPEYVPLDEQHPLHPRSVYAATKLSCEKHCMVMHHWYNYPVVVVRNFNTFGENQNVAGYPAAIPNFVERALRGEPIVIHNGGRQTRDFMYVKDAVRAYGMLVQNGRKFIGQAFNIGTGKEISILDLAQLVIRLTGSKSQVRHEEGRPADLPRLCAGIEKIRASTGWSPEFSLESGLQRTIAWFQGHLQ
ncbi:MAG: GDP-mannose 4,6-dehydratase [Candidatus Omnitrophica bacterium]|nr:GDP-mannose 4,6-dehydratase [Candidatus Omnitrophota bacterium]